MHVRCADVKSYSTLVDSVNEGNKPSRQVPFSVRHTRYPRDYESMVAPHQLQIVGSSGCSSNQFVELEHYRTSTGFGDLDLPSPNLLGSGMGWLVLEVTEESKPPISMGNGGFVQRMMIDTRRWPWYFPVIGCRVKIQDSKTSFKQIYAGDERLALNAIFVQVIRVPIRGSDEDYSVRH